MLVEFQRTWVGVGNEARDGDELLVEAGSTSDDLEIEDDSPDLEIESRERRSLYWCIDRVESIGMDILEFDGRGRVH